MTSPAEKTQILFKSQGLTHHVTKTSSGSEVHSYISDLGPDTPILTLIHGYPQAAYEWRYVVPALQGKISLYVPELPGYGISSPIKSSEPVAANSKRSVGNALLESLSAVFSTKTASSPRKIIIGGHDRGARISHRLAVDFLHPPEPTALGATPETSRIYSALNLTVLGTVLLDIMPTSVQWSRFADPVIAQGYFHWPLLANAELAATLLDSFGGSQWARSAHTRISGQNSKSLERITANEALDIYGGNFATKEVLYYTALDYAAGAAPEATEQDEDQKAGRKIGVPILVMFSQANLGARTDVAAVWKDWVQDGVDYKGVGVGDGYGHYLPEEAADTVVEHFLEFIKKVT